MSEDKKKIKRNIFFLKVKVFFLKMFKMSPGIITGFIFGYFFLLQESISHISVNYLIIIILIITIINIILYIYIKKKKIINKIVDNVEKDIKRKDKLGQVFPNTFKNDEFDESGGLYGDNLSLDEVISQAKKL